MDAVILVDAHDRKIGEMDKMEAHLGEGKLHRAVSVFFFNKEGQLLIQQRSEEKIVGALQWANTCCGNVRPDEIRLPCAKRRLKEELGIEGVALRPVYKFRYQVRCNEKYSENEIDVVFVGRFNGDPAPNSHEVKSTRWIDWRNLPNLDYAPWFQIMIKDEQLLEILDRYVKR